MSSIPSAFNLGGLAQRTYQKTEVFDTAGNHTWTHPLPGQNIEVFVELYGGGGGCANQNSAAASSGGDTIWDTSGSPLTAIGGSGGDYSNPTTTGLAGPGLYNAVNMTAGTDASTYNNGSNHYGAVISGNNSGEAEICGNVGDVKRFNVIASNDINLTVGAGGTGASGIGNDGAVIVSYNITTTQTPVVANLQRRDWEHFGEVTWRTGSNAPVQSVSSNTPTAANLNYELLDTGNKVALVGSNQFTLQAGTYEFRAMVTSANEATANGSESLMLYNITDSILTASEISTLDMSTTSGMGKITMEGVFVVPSQKTFELRILHSHTTNGDYGNDTTEAFTSSTEIDRFKFQFKWRA
jgi:hypothetical protein